MMQALQPDQCGFFGATQQKSVDIQFLGSTMRSCAVQQRMSLMPCSLQRSN